MLAPIVSDQVVLTSAADNAADAVFNSLRCENDATPRVRATLVSGAYVANGLSFDATGRLFYVDATAGLPANTTYCSGLPITPTGALCISTNAPATWSNGVPFVTNGAVSATVTA